MKNRLWFILTLFLSLSVMAPVFSQTGETTEEEAVTPGEEPTTTETTKDTTTTTTDESSSMEAKMWKNSQTSILFANSAQKFELSAKDSLSNVDYTEYRIDSSSYRKYTGPISIADEGSHTIVYRSVDKAGNVESDHVYNVVIDNTNPQVQVIPSKPFVNKNGGIFTSPGNVFTIRATDKFSGLKSIKYSVNGAPLKDYVTNDTIKLVESGSQLIKYEAVDNLGNQQAGGTSVLVNVDGSKPVVKIKPSHQLMNVGEQKYAKRATGFVVDASDVGSGIEVLLVKIDDSAEWQVYTDTIYFDTEKAHSVEAKALDYVGNESAVVKLSFVVDDNPPTTDLQPVSSSTTEDTSTTNDANKTEPAADTNP